MSCPRVTFRTSELLLETLVALVEAEIAGADKDAAADESDSDSRGTAEVVSLDSFRKKT